MKTSNDAKMTVCSIAVTLSILLITLGVYLGTQYLDENYVKYDVEQMLNVCNQIPDPTERKEETITIDKRWIVKSVIANRIYPQLSNQDGIQFFSDYAIRHGWVICKSRWGENKRGDKIYYLTLKKKDISCYIAHEEFSEKWRIWIQKDDILEINDNTLMEILKLMESKKSNAKINLNNGYVAQKKYNEFVIKKELLQDNYSIEFEDYFENDEYIIRKVSNYDGNSNNVLPQPLSEEDEAKLLLEVKNGSIDARNELIEHNLRLVVFIAKKFESTKINMEDLISIGSIGLIKGIQTFKMEKNIKLATYASRCIENEILMHLRKTQRTRQEYSLDEVLSIDSEGNEMILSDIISSNETLALTKMTEEEDVKNLYYAIDKLTPREKEIVIMRYGLYGEVPLTQKEVADKLGISQSYISRLEKRIIDKMRQEIENLVKIA